MAGLVPAIHVFGMLTEDVDARHKAGHDGSEIVIAGLDPAIHAALPSFRRFSMDHRVKPGGDES